MKVLWRLVLILFLCGPVFAQEEGGDRPHEVIEVDDTASTNNPPAILMFGGKELFQLSGISSVSAEIRVETMKRRLKRLAKSPLASTDDFVIHNDDNMGVTMIKHGEEVICAVWKTDAELNETHRTQLAEEWHEIIATAIDEYRQDRTASSIIRSSIFAVITTLIYLTIWWLIRKLFNKEMNFIESKFAGHQTLKLLDGDSIVTINNNCMKTIRALIVLTVFIVYLNIVLSFFPWTFNLSAKLFDLISTPVINFGHAFVDNLPGLFAIGVIVSITHYVLKGLKHMFEQIAEGKVRIRGFYTDWADTTFSLIRMVIVVFAAVIAWPYIPGHSSPAFKGISIFMGVLVSLGSSSAMGNIFGGLMLTYMRSFAPGDFVKINDMRGTVMARRTFSTRLKTPTNEIISIPNSAVSANPIVNYSRMTKSIGVNIGTAVTIGYDVPWRKVHEQLLKSAEGVPDVLEDPAPTILQLGLEDFYVKYKLVVSTKNPAGKFRILSNLHQNIQDNFAKAGIEIMSPHYQADRSGETITIPDDMGIPAEVENSTEE
jgi:small-conductance mechanosensitive channel